MGNRVNKKCFSGLQEVTCRLRPMGPVDIHQGKELRIIKVRRATCTNALKGKKWHRAYVRVPLRSGEMEKEAGCRLGRA